MELKIKPHYKNTAPIGGVLIKNTSVAYWVKEIQRMRLSLADIDVYPVPGTAANTVWGCLIIPFTKTDNLDLIGNNEFCQMISGNLFIVEKSILHPFVSAAEIEKMFVSGKHIMHPEFGLAELTEKLAVEEMLLIPAIIETKLTKPKPSVFIPKEVKSFQVKPVSPEEMMKKMEEDIFPKKEKLKDKPLSLFEKGKLAFYKALFSRTKSGEGNTESSTSVERSGFLSKIEDFFNRFTNNKIGKWTDKLQEDFEDLEERNKKHIDRLMDMLKNNQLEALKYAIPLDGIGSTRGGNKGQFDFSKRWANFSLFNNNTSSGSGGGSIDLGDYYNQLQAQYRATAQNLIDQKEYQKAAFVYMKLLKDNHSAAMALEQGKHYQEAAMVYLTHINRKDKAAECYEKGKMTNEAIELYKELNQNEKVGDLYLSLKKRKEANVYYTKVVDEYKTNYQYVKASLIYKNKMEDSSAGQSLLMQGWLSDCDAFNCLNNYYANIDDLKTLKTEIVFTYNNDVTLKNRELFLKVIQHEYNKENELAEMIKDMAYEIIATEIPNNPSIVSELKAFNKKDQELMKDTLRFKFGGK